MDLDAVYQGMALLAIIVFLYTLMAKKIESTIISGPMVFVAIGVALGPIGAGLIGNEADMHVLRLFADMTLALILFSDAAHSNLTVLKAKAHIPVRMLSVGLPIAILFGAVIAMWVFDVLTWVEAGILATMLGATDAALGKAVISDKNVPASVREGLNVESGLNDGLCVPILLVLLAIASSTSGEVSGVEALMVAVEEIGIGLLVGLSFAYLAAKMIGYVTDRGSLSPVWMHLTVAALALSCFSVAQTYHGSGYIASFCGGMLFGRLMQQQKHTLILTAESVAELLAMLTWILFGATIIGQVLEEFTPSIILYSLLSLTVIRMIPVYMSLVGSPVPKSQRLFMGWFGPRGLASVVFAVIVVDAGLASSHFIALVVTTTVIISLVLHGITAKPLSTWIGNKNHPE